RDVVDLAPADSTLVVDLLEVGADHLADGAVGRGGAAVGGGVAELDLGGGHAGRLGAGRRRQRQAERQRERESQELPVHECLLVPGLSTMGRREGRGHLVVPFLARRSPRARSAPAIPCGITYMNPIRNRP